MGKKTQKSKVDGTKLRLYREGFGLTIEELAADIAKRAAAEKKKGISSKTIWRLEQGGHAYPYTLERVADALGVEPKDLLQSENLTISVSQHDDFNYLRCIEHVLKVGMPEEPKWFRKSGPIAADFDDGRIYRREEKLDKLKELVMNNSVSMLEGLGATGKTVLVLNLAYDLYKVGETQVYYFDCDKERDFDKSRLIYDMKSTGGIFILDDIHLAPEKFQSIYHEFKHDKNKHILFVGRPSFREFQYSRGEDLAQIKSLKIEPFDKVDALIKNYSLHPETPEIEVEVGKQIKEVSSGNFWLLSYALRGYAKRDLSGDPKSWLEKGVKEDLNDSKNIKMAFPEVLVAISALYRNEVLTAESYLADKLEFSYEVLNELVQRGEIICQRRNDGYVFYGLPHSALAGAYWEYGKEYRNRRQLPGYEDFILEYAKSDVPNGLEAIMEARENFEELLLKRLDVEGKLAKCIWNETSIDTFSWVCYVDRSIIEKPDILEALAWKLEENDDPELVTTCVNTVYLQYGKVAGRSLWNLLDRRKLADRIVDQASLHFCERCIHYVNEIDRNAARELCGFLNIEELVAACSDQIEDCWDVLGCVSVICLANKKVGRKLWRLLDKENLATGLNRMGDWRLKWRIKDIWSADPNIAKELCGLLNMNTDGLVMRLNMIVDLKDIDWYIGAVLSANLKVGRRLWQLSKKTLAAKLNQTEDISAISSCIEVVYSWDPDMAWEFCGLLNIKSLTKLVDQEDDDCGGGCLSILLRVNIEVGQKLWQHVNKKSLVAKFSDSNHVKTAGTYLNDIFEADSNVAKEFCSLLDINKLALRLNETDDSDKQQDYLEIIEKANKNVYQKLLKVLNVKNEKG